MRHAGGAISRTVYTDVVKVFILHHLGLELTAFTTMPCCDSYEKYTMACQ